MAEHSSELEVRGLGQCVCVCVHDSHQAPERPLLGGNDGGSTGGVVHQCQLPEAALVVILAHTLSYAINQYHYVIDSSGRRIGRGRQGEGKGEK